MEILDAADLKELQLPYRDQKEMLVRIGRAVSVQVAQPKEVPSRRFQVDAHRINGSDSSESSAFNLDHITDDLLELSCCARDLRQSYMLCPPCSGAAVNRKPDPMDLTLSEFLNESLRLLSRLVRSRQNREVSIEYSSYLEYLVIRSVDFFDEAVLAFGREFRKGVAFKGSSLSESELRRTIADKHFHSATRHDTDII